MGDCHRLRPGAWSSPEGKLIEGVQALYWRPPDADEAATFGLTPDDYEPPTVNLWPENWPPVELFMQLHTQWRTGPGGAVGLDYGVVFHELDRRDLSRDEYDELMAAIRIIESTALKAMREK